MTESQSFSRIERVNGRRIVTVSGRVDRSVANPDDIEANLWREVLPELKDRFVGLQIQSAGFAQDQAESPGITGKAESAHAAGDFCPSGVFAAQLLATADHFSWDTIWVPQAPLLDTTYWATICRFYSLFGVVALSGVVVNDSLILVDRYNKFRAEGRYSVEQAVLLATQRRFRPIFLTTATTSLGLMPLIFETSTTAQFMIPMAISLAVGILFASILILFIVPTLLVIKEGSNQAYASDQLQDSVEAKTVRIS